MSTEIYKNRYLDILNFTEFRANLNNKWLYILPEIYFVLACALAEKCHFEKLSQSILGEENKNGIEVGKKR